MRQASCMTDPIIPVELIRTASMLSQEGLPAKVGVVCQPIPHRAQHVMAASACDLVRSVADAEVRCRWRRLLC